MSWDVETTEVFREWLLSLSEAEQDSLIAAVDVLEERGPTLGRPLVDTLKGSKTKNLKELRPPTGNIRVLFAFDPRRKAILLVGGDKTGKWSRWYKEMIPKAEALYSEHLASIKEE